MNRIVYLIYLVFLSILVSLGLGCASVKEIRAKETNKDTSFTISSAYFKELKKYPYIKIAQPVTDPNVVTKRNIPYKKIPGRKLLVDISYPKIRNENMPCILLIHGGGWKSGDKNQMEAIALRLASSGFVAISPEYRLTAEAKYPAALNDLQDALTWLKENSQKIGVDTARVAVLGVSAGGQLAALLGTINNKHASGLKIKAIVDIDGILAFHHPESQEGASASEWLGGTYQEKPLTWEDASPLSHAGPHTPAMLFINSQQTRFHAGRDDLLAKIKPFGIYSETYTIPDTPHTFWLFDPWFKPTLDYTIAFLNKTVKNDEISVHGLR